MSEQAHDKAMLAGVLICGVSVAAYSSWAQFSIAVAAGYPAQLAWVVPVATDATAALGTRAWMSPHYSDHVRNYGCLLAISAIVLSFLTAALHLVIPTDVPGVPTGVPIPWQIRLAIGGLPSLALAALVHLGALTAKDKPRQKVTKSQAARKTASPRAALAVEQVSPVATSVTVGQVAVTENAMNLSTSAIPDPNKAGSGSNRQRMFDYLDAHPDTSGADLDKIFGTTNYGRKVRNAWESRRTLHVVNQASGE